MYPGDPGQNYDNGAKENIKLILIIFNIPANRNYMSDVCAGETKCIYVARVWDVSQFVRYAKWLIASTRRRRCQGSLGVAVYLLLCFDILNRSRLHMAIFPGLLPGWEKFPKWKYTYKHLEFTRIHLLGTPMR